MWQYYVSVWCVLLTFLSDNVCNDDVLLPLFVLGLMLLIMCGCLLRIIWIAKPKYFGFVSYVCLSVFSAVLANKRVHYFQVRWWKAKAYNTCIAPQVAYCSCRGAGHDTERAGVGPIGSRQSLRPQADLWPTAKRMRLLCCLMVSTLHPRNPCNYLDYYSFTDPEGMEGWVGLVGWPIANALPTKWSHVNHRSGTDQGKSASQIPMP